MPAKSKAQQGFFGAELARQRAGMATETGLDPSQLEDFAATKTKGLPQHKKPDKRGFGSEKRSEHGRHKRGRGDTMK